MTDRTTKALLVLIAVALWGLLLRPMLTPAPVKAQGADVIGNAPNKDASVVSVVPSGTVYVVDTNHIAAYKINIDGKIVEVDRKGWNQLGRQVIQYQAPKTGGTPNQ